MPPTLAEIIAGAKNGIADYLQTTPGLRPADEVTVRSAAPDPEEPIRHLIVLGDVIAPQAQAGLQTRQGSPTMTCEVSIVEPGVGEVAIRAARARATAVMKLVEQALAADLTAAGAVPGPGQIRVATSGLQEGPVDWSGAAARQATIPFSLTWTSHFA